MEPEKEKTPEPEPKPEAKPETPAAAAPPAPKKPALDPATLQVASSPHVRDPETVPGIMWWVVVSLLPACAWGCYGYGLSAFYVVVTAVLAAMATEGLIQKMRRLPVTLHDHSALLTGLLLAMTIPPSTPLYQVALGAVFAIAVAKQAFGGLGHNIVNPALAGRAFLLASFPASIKLSAYPGWADGLTSATFLESLKKGAAGLDVAGSIFPGLIGREGGALGEISVLLLLAGGLVLLAKKIIDWRVPAFFIGTVALAVFVLPRSLGNGAYSGWFAGGAALGGTLPYLALHVVSGGLFLGAFYMATDMVTSPLTRRGKIVFACGCGLLTALIRLYGGYPEGVCYSILIMNLTVPLLDSWFGAPIFGRRKTKANA